MKFLKHHAVKDSLKTQKFQKTSLTIYRLKKFITRFPFEYLLILRADASWLLYEAVKFEIHLH